MGERALIILKQGDEYSPALYTHWGGLHVHDYVRRLREIAAPEPQDPNGPEFIGFFAIDAAFARLVVIAHLHTDAEVFHLPNPFDPASASIGDGPTYIVDMDNGFAVHCNGRPSPPHGNLQGGRPDRIVSRLLDNRLVRKLVL